MKQIKKLSIWNNGKIIFAEWIKVNISFDNLIDSAVLNYFLFSEIDNAILSGSVKIESENYTKWDGSIDNTYNIVLKQLNIELA